MLILAVIASCFATSETEKGVQHWFLGRVIGLRVPEKGIKMGGVQNHPMLAAVHVYDISVCVSGSGF